MADSRRSMSRSRTMTNSQGCRLPALPDQRATSRMSCRTDFERGSGRSWRTARRPRRKAIRAEAESVSDESFIGGLSAEAQVQEEFIDIGPAPVLSRLKRLNQRMLAGVEVFC